jgi:hypothetical protein
MEFPIYFHYKFFDLKIFGFAIFEQKDTFFKKSIKILRISFFLIGKNHFVRNYLYFKKTRRKLQKSHFSIFQEYFAQGCKYLKTPK